MPLEIATPEAYDEHLNEPAKSRLRAAVEKYTNDLLEEAGRLEATVRTTQGNPEITSSIVGDADLYLRRGYRKPKKSGWFTFVQIVQAVSTLVTGILFNLQAFQTEQLYFLVFVIVLAVAIGTNVLVFVKE
jgi:hypothetical protein